MTEVAGRIFGNGAQGPVASRLAALYDDWMTRPEHREEFGAL